MAIKSFRYLKGTLFSVSIYQQNTATCIHYWR